MNNYCIINYKTGKGLSQFRPQDSRRSPFRFNNNSVMSFATIEEAEKQLQSIITRTPAQHKRAALNLRVSMYAKGF